tara:strand:+ start:2144 stop:2587 length:444 start_codon:yes stop_codon:yes gene_type:complete
MTRNSLSIFNELRPYTVGFDNAFDVFERMFENDYKLNHGHNGNYPPYNIMRTGDYTYNIELALAGFNKKDINVEYADNTLTVKSIDTEEEDKDGTIYKGISKRKFTRTFTLADDVEVKGAELKDGLLTVSLEKIVPEAKKARSITIK